MVAYAVTIFTGAFLLFQVEPLIGKYILPWFGGSPGVWTTCLLFFQTVLLGGYAYAHYSCKFLPVKRQTALHLALLALALALLPIAPAETWKPQVAGDPTWRILALLAVNLGLPYLVLSATGPLVQHWCSRTHPGVAPYRLYALSNAGSLLALVTYPFYFEWAFSRSAQAKLWAWGLAGFALICGFCAVRAARSRVTGAEGPPDVPFRGAAPSRTNRLLWLALPAAASVLLLATTNKLCQDLAVVPFLWVLPLGLYLLTFIICFDSPRWYRRGLFSALTVVGIAVVADLFFAASDISIVLQVVGYSGALFAGCLFCHGELYRLKPDPRDLTAYYLVISAGGALGGFLVAVVAPLVFNSYLELPLGYCALIAMLALVGWRDRSRPLALGAGVGVLLAMAVIPVLGLDSPSNLKRAAIAWFRVWTNLSHHYPRHFEALALLAAAVLICFGDRRRLVAREWRPRAGAFLLLLFPATVAMFGLQLRDSRQSAVSVSRNFFGVLTVYSYKTEDPKNHYYMLEHGQTIHGLQFTEPVKATWPTTYYGETSGVGLAIRGLPPGPRRLGLVGLGTGTLAAYGRKGDTVRIYEINPQVKALATSRFTYLARCPAHVDVVLGDARLSMESELARGEPQRFDLLALDAFNSDAIPVHLLTREAFAIYLQQLKPDGVIAVHISNRYFDLEPVVTALAKHFGLACVTISDDDEAEWWVYQTTWMLVAKNPARLKTPLIADSADAPAAPAAAPPPLWTDDYTSLFKILR